MTGLLHAPSKGFMFPRCCVLDEIANLAALQHDESGATLQLGNPQWITTHTVIQFIQG